VKATAGDNANDHQDFLHRIPLEVFFADALEISALKTVADLVRA
jgi:hypothetical protein